MAISITVFPVHIYSSHLSGYAAIELSSLAQKVILYYGIKISSTAQIDKSEHMWLMQFNSIRNDIRMKP
jgi:hypothetical protein